MFLDYLIIPFGFIYLSFLDYLIYPKSLHHVINYAKKGLVLEFKKFGLFWPTLVMVTI